MATDSVGIADKKRTSNSKATSLWAKNKTSRIDNPQLLLTCEEAARALSISPRTLWTLTKNGEIPVIQVGSRSIRYSIDDLQTWIERKRRGGSGVPEADQISQYPNSVRA